ITRTGRKPSGTDTATSPPSIGTSTRLTYSELAKCTAMSDGPGGKLVSVTRPSASVVPRQFVVFSESAISDGAPRPSNSMGDAGRGAWLHDDRSAVEERVRAGDGDIRDARLREDRHVERQHRDAVRQRTDPCRSVGVELDRVRIRRIEDRSAAPVERAAADRWRRDGLTGRGDEPYAEIGRGLEMDHRQPQHSRSQHGDTELVGREPRYAHADAVEPGPVASDADAAAAVARGRRGSDQRRVH